MPVYHLEMQKKVFGLLSNAPNISWQRFYFSDFVVIMSEYEPPCIYLYIVHVEAQVDA